MKRTLLLLLVCLLFSISIFGCTQPDVPQEPAVATPEPAVPVQESPAVPDDIPTPEQNPDSEPVVEGVKLNIVTTIFPQYDWVYQILGDKAEFKDVTLLLNNRIDLHNFQPSVSDIALISTCDLFIYIGGESDAWVEAVLEQALNPNMVVINLLVLLGENALIDEEIDDGRHHHHHHHDDEFDEHVWLSLRNAITFINVIVNALSSLDPDLSEVYITNGSEYIDHLYALDLEYSQVVSNASRNTLLFADRFPFRYLMHDYGLNFFAAFSGCSAETEASFQTIAFLTKKVDEHDLTAIMVTESANISIAETIIGNTADKNQRILVLDSMQSSNDVDRQHGITYLSIMEENLRVLKEALD